MIWTLITGPTDNPPERQMVLVSNDSTVGLAYHRDIDPKYMEHYGFRADGWLLVWPVDPDHKYVVKKWQNIPAA